MQSTTNVIRGFLLAQSSTILLNPPCTFLEIQTSEGQKIKIIASIVKLPDHVVCGNYYKFTNLQPRRVQDFDHLFYQLTNSGQIELEAIAPCKEVPAVSRQSKGNFVGKITAVDEKFGMYQVDDSKTLVLSYLKHYCDFPTLRIGDEVEVKRAHLYIDLQGDHYYVLCFRSYFNVRSSEPSEKRERAKRSFFNQFVEICGLGIKNLLWLRKHEHVIKKCIKDTFLQSLGVPCVDVVYGDLLMMLLSTQEELAEKIRRPAYRRNTLREFYLDPHHCLPMQTDSFCLPHIPLSLFEVLDPLLKMDIQNNDGRNWNFNISETEFNRPLLAYVGISKMSHRLCLMDGNGLELPVVPVKGKVNLWKYFSHLNGKIVLVEKPLIIMETFTEEEVQNPAAEYLNEAKFKYIYVMVEIDNVKVFGPHGTSFSSWTMITVINYVKEHYMDSRTGKTMSSDMDSRTGKTMSSASDIQTTATPLQERSSFLDSYVAERYIVLHKTPLQLSSSNDISAYLMVKKLPSQNFVNGAGNSDSSSQVFFKIQRPHANFHDLIPSSGGEIELRLPKEKANFIRTRRSVPWSYAIKSKLKTTDLITLPAEVEIYVVNISRRIHADVYSVVEAVNDTRCGNELISVMGLVVRRSVEIGKFEREKRWFSNNKSFGLPGAYSVLVLDISDPGLGTDSSGQSTRLYLSWQKSHQYPLGVLPGATIVVNFVYRAQTNSKTYLRSTSLTSIEVVELPKSLSSVAQLSVDVPTGPWLSPHRLSEGASGWFILEPRYLKKLELKAICKGCGEPYANKACSYPGCSSPLGPKLSASAQVFVEENKDRDTLLVRDENVRVLLGVSDLEWESLLVLADRTGGVKYYRKAEAREKAIRNLPEQVLATFCRNIFRGESFFCYCRRFKSAGQSVSSLFCILLQPSSARKAVVVARSFIPAPKRPNDGE